MAPSYIAGVVLILANVLPLLHIDIAPEAINTTITTIITIIGGLIVLYRQLANGRSTFFGIKPSV